MQQVVLLHPSLFVVQLNAIVVLGDAPHAYHLGPSRVYSVPIHEHVLNLAVVRLEVRERFHVLEVEVRRHDLGHGSPQRIHLRADAERAGVEERLHQREDFLRWRHYLASRRLLAVLGAHLCLAAVASVGARHKLLRLIVGHAEDAVAADVADGTHEAGGGSVAHVRPYTCVNKGGYTRVPCTLREQRGGAGLSHESKREKGVLQHTA